MDDVATIIREYALPLTRGDWRRLHKYTNDRFQEDLVVLNYNLYLKVYNNKRNGGFLLENFKYLYQNKKLFFYNGLYYSIEDLNELVVVLKHGSKKMYCLYSADRLERDGYVYQNVDQILYILAVFNVRQYILEQLILSSLCLYYGFIVYKFLI